MSRSVVAYDGGSFCVMFHQMDYMFFIFESGMMLFLIVSILSACCMPANLFAFSVYAVVICILQLLYSGSDFYTLQ